MTQHPIEANSPEWHEHQIKEINIILKELSKMPPTPINKKLADIAYQLSKGHLGELQLQIAKLRELTITADGFHDFVDKFGKPYKGVLLKFSVKSIASNNATPIEPIKMGEHDQAIISLFSPYYPEKK